MLTVTSFGSGAGVAVGVGGTGVCVGGSGVAVGGTGVGVGGAGVAVGTPGAAAVGCGVAVGGTGVEVGGTAVAVGGTGVAVAGTGVDVGGTGVGWASAWPAGTTVVVAFMESGWNVQKHWNVPTSSKVSEKEAPSDSSPLSQSPVLVPREPEVLV